MTGPSSTPRPRVDQLTGDQLDALYAELDRCDRIRKAALDGRNAAVQRADQAEAELTALKAITTGYCPRCGRGDCSPTADQWLEQRQRADRAEAAIARVRALHTRWDADPASCAHCVDSYGTPVRYPCPTIRALDGAT